MGSQRVIRKTVALTDKLQVGFAGFEEYLDLPSFAVYSNDLFFREHRIGANESDPIFLVLLISNADDFGGDLLILSCHDLYGKQIFTAAAALFADTEDFIDGKLLPLECGSF